MHRIGRDRVVHYLSIINRIPTEGGSEEAGQLFNELLQISFPLPKPRIQRYYAALDRKGGGVSWLNFLTFFLLGRDSRVPCEVWLSEDEGEPFLPGHPIPGLENYVDVVGDDIPPLREPTPDYRQQSVGVEGEDETSSDDDKPSRSQYWIFRAPFRFELLNKPLKALDYLYNHTPRSHLQVNGNDEKMAIFVIKASKTVFDQINIPFKEEGRLLSEDEWYKYARKYVVNRHLRGLSFYQYTF